MFSWRPKWRIKRISRTVCFASEMLSHMCLIFLMATSVPLSDRLADLQMRQVLYHDSIQHKLCTKDQFKHVSKTFPAK